MKILVNKKKFIAFSIWSIFTFLQWLLMSQLTYSDDTLVLVSLTVMINLFFQILTMVYINIPVISYFSLFIGLLYIFHFGQVFTAAFFPQLDYGITNYVSHYMINREVAWETIVWSLTSINMIFTGGLLSSKYDITTENKSSIQDNIAYTSCYYMGRFLFIVSFPIKIYIDMRQMMLAMSGGYAIVNSTSFTSGALGAFASFWYISIPLIYLTSKTEKGKRWFIILSFTYICLTMLTGNRGHQIVNMIAIILIILVILILRAKLLFMLLRWQILYCRSLCSVQRRVCLNRFTVLNSMLQSAV